jgi:glycosyltransferase involved in cell wall biosynthesis
MADHVSIIIPAQNEVATIGHVIREAGRLAPLEIIVVVNGSNDGTAELCRSADCKVYEFANALGNDVGRSVGAYYARGDILLFLDADIPVSHLELSRFVNAIRSGSDIALNNMTGTLPLSAIPHYTTVAKFAFNQMLRRPALSINSLLAIPHAMSKKAAETIGFDNLSNPCLAHALAVTRNLKMASPAAVDVIASNKTRAAHSTPSPFSVFPQSTNRIIGDHLEALSDTILRFGPRGGFAEGTRNRGIIRNYVPPKTAGKAKRSAIIPVKEESGTIRQVIRSVRAAQVDEIIVVANGADETTVRIAMETGARVMVFNQPLGHNVGRAIGAACSTGDVCLFVDGDFVVPPEDLRPYIEAVENGAEVALNDLQSLFYRFIPVDPISAVKYFLNICLNQPGLLNNSLTAVPHALSRKALNVIGFEKLVIPPPCAGQSDFVRVVAKGGACRGCGDPKPDSQRAYPR